MIKFLCQLSINEQTKEYILSYVTSEYIFKTRKENDDLIIEIEKNENFILNFYSEMKKSSEQINIRAIVGQNSSGKTHFLFNAFYLKGINIFLEIDKEGEKILVYNSNKNDVTIFFEKKLVDFELLNPNEKIKNIFFSNSFEPKWNSHYENFAVDLSLNQNLKHFNSTNNINDLNRYFTENMSKQATMLNTLELMENKETFNSVSKLMEIPDDLIANVVDSKFISFGVDIIDALDYFFDCKYDLEKYFGDVNDKKTETFKDKLILNTKIAYISERLISNDLMQVLDGIKNFNNVHLDKDIEIVELKNSITLIKEKLKYTDKKNSVYKNKQILNREENKEFFEGVNNIGKSYIKFNDLFWDKISSGQYNLLNLFEKLYSFDLEKITNVNLFIDEADLGLHPEWQRKWVNHIPVIIFEILKSKNPNFNYLQIILATHSPIMLSDIRREDVNFLYRDFNKNGHDNIRTFGSNINDLISESFFLEGGLMGEYSQKIINKVIKHLDSQDDKEKLDVGSNQLSYLINEIGEIYLRKSLMKKFQLVNIENKKINSLKNQIDVLQKELDILTGDNDD